MPLPNNRLNDDLSKIHAELFKKENINYNHKNGLTSMTPLDEPKSKSEDGIALLDEQGDKKNLDQKKKICQSIFFFSMSILKKNPLSDSDSIPSIIIVNENDSNTDDDITSTSSGSKHEDLSSLSDRLSSLEISKPNRAKSAPVESDRSIPILPKLPSRTSTLDWDEDDDESRKSL